MNLSYSRKENGEAQVPNLSFKAKYKVYVKKNISYLGYTETIIEQKKKLTFVLTLAQFLVFFIKYEPGRWFIV